MTARDCMSSPPAEGESAVGALFVKQSCEMNDEHNKRKISLRVNFFRKPGQQLASGEEESQECDVMDCPSPEACIADDFFRCA